MTTINSIPSNYANAIMPYAPLGQQPVGQESGDLKSSSFKALEQPAASARDENRRPPEDQTSIAQADAKKLDAKPGVSSANELEQQRKQEELAKAEKAEAAKQAEKQERLRQEERAARIKAEQREAFGDTEERLARSRAEQIDTFTQINSKTFDINRRLVEMGAIDEAPSKGTLFNQKI